MNKLTPAAEAIEKFALKLYPVIKFGDYHWLEQENERLRECIDELQSLLPSPPKTEV